MLVTFNFSYTELVVPPRCRKPKPVTKEDGIHCVSIPELTGEDAPVAIRETYLDQTLEYRWWDNLLWTNKELDTHQHRELPALQQSYSIEEVNDIVKSRFKEDVVNELKKKFGRFILIDNILHAQVLAEPRLVVQYKYDIPRERKMWAVVRKFEYAPNERLDNHFRPDQPNELANYIAKWMEVDEDFDIANDYSYEILISGCLRLNPAQDQADADEAKYQECYPGFVHKANHCFWYKPHLKRALKQLLEELETAKG